MYEFALAQVSEPTSSCFISLSLSQNCQEKNLKKCDMTMVNSPVLSAWGSLTANPKCSHHRPEKELSTEEGGEHTQWLVVMFHGGHHKYMRSLIFYALKDLGKKLLTLKKKISLGPVSIMLPPSCSLSVLENRREGRQPPLHHHLYPTMWAVHH